MELIANICVPVSDVAGRRHLQSACYIHRLTVLRVRRSTSGSRAFASAGPTVCNSLPGVICVIQLLVTTSFEVTGKRSCLPSRTSLQAH